MGTGISRIDARMQKIKDEMAQNGYVYDDRHGLMNNRLDYVDHLRYHGKYAKAQEVMRHIKRIIGIQKRRAHAEKEFNHSRAVKRLDKKYHADRAKMFDAFMASKMPWILGHRQKARKA